MLKVKVSSKYALIDDEDFDLVMKRPLYPYQKLKINKWVIKQSKHLYYATCSWRTHLGGWTSMRMHRLILGLTHTDRLIIDHKNGDGLDNRRANLRVCTQSQNMANSRQHIETHSGFKGVRWVRGSKKWAAHVTVNHKQIYLGLFECKNQAANAYNERAIKEFGVFACLNKI